MIVITPLTVVDATLDSSNVAESDHAEWLVGTSYTQGDNVIVATTEPNIHRRYESLINSNQGNEPWLEPDPAVNWLDLGATNRWAMFDNLNNSRTTNPDTIEVEITPGAVVNGVAALNLAAASVQVIVDDPVSGEVYNRTINLVDDSGIVDWYAYFFSPIEQSTDIVFLDLPAFGTATITVIVENTGDTAEIGMLAMGLQKRIGITEHGTGIGIIDYSRKVLDAFGNVTIQERTFSKRADYVVFLNTARVANIQNFLTGIRATPVVWIGDEDFGSTLIYGYYRDFDIILSGPLTSDASIIVEGLT